MEQHLRTQNQSKLVELTGGVSFIYIWLGLFAILFGAYRSGFLGIGMGGAVVAGLFCLLFLNPLVPMLVKKYVVEPIVLNLLGTEIVSSTGCMSGLGVFFFLVAAVAFFLARDIRVAVILFFSAPILGAIVAGVVSLLNRANLKGGGVKILPPSGAPIPKSIETSREKSRSLPPGRRSDSQLQSKTQQSLPPPKRRP